ncbi:MAG: zinc transport system substrate-binding protein [Paracoccaceae bacterium]
MLRKFSVSCLVFLAVGSIAAAPVSATAPKVVATIPPLHSLAAMAMEGVGFPDLLLNGGETPHSFALRPSHSRLLASADIIIRIGDGFEGFLRKPLRSLARRATVLQLDSLPDLVTYPNRRTDGHDNEHEDDHGHGHAKGHAQGMDPHLWLHTGNAIQILRAISAALSKADPENAPVYQGNAARGAIRLRALKMEIDRIVAPVRERPYFVFHDAWQYFDREFGLRGGGAIAISPERKPGARRLAETRDRIRVTGARCVFAEPQFPPALVKTVIRGTAARLAVLDPLGAGLVNGPGQYFQMMRNLANGIASCLKTSSR